MAAGNTDGDLAMLQWTAGSPHRTLELVVRHTDGDREYAYDRDPILGSGTETAPRGRRRAPVDRDRHGRRLGRRARVDLIVRPPRLELKHEIGGAASPTSAGPSSSRDEEVRAVGRVGSTGARLIDRGDAEASYADGPAQHPGHLGRRHRDHAT